VACTPLQAIVDHVYVVDVCVVDDRAGLLIGGVISFTAPHA
jgi:hypothetical protein